MEPNYNYYEIDTSDIWEHERTLFLEGKSSEDIARKVLYDIQLLIAEQAKPVFGLEDYDRGDEQYKRYYQRMVNQFIEASNNLENLYRIEYFFFKDGCYQYDYNILIARSEKDFEFWFGLKLRQYESKISAIFNFLNYQLNRSFDDDLDAFCIFLKFNMRQYHGELFTDKVIDTINEWKVTKPKNEKVEEPERQDDDDNNIQQEDNQFDEPQRKGLKIHPDYQESVIKALQPFFNEKEHTLLNNLIKGEEINDKIYFLGNANRFVMVMRQLHLHQKVVNNYVQTNEWICGFFQYKHNTRGRSDFAQSDVHKILTAGSFEIPKEKRIEIPSLDFIKEKSKKI